MEEITIYFKPVNIDRILNDEIFADKVHSANGSCTVKLRGKCKFEGGFVIIMFDHDGNSKTQQRQIAFPSNLIVRVDTQTGNV